MRLNEDRRPETGKDRRPEKTEDRRPEKTEDRRPETVLKARPPSPVPRHLTPSPVPRPCTPSPVSKPMPPQYKFQKLDIYHLAIHYVKSIYSISRTLPDRERYNLSNQVERASTSIVLNIAEGSTGQSDAEQNRFLGLALRSYLETIACLDLSEEHGYINSEQTKLIREQGHQLFIKISSLRKSLNSKVHN